MSVPCLLKNETTYTLHVNVKIEESNQLVKLKAKYSRAVRKD